MSKRIVIFALSILVLLIVFPVSAGEWKYGQFGTWYENSDGSRPTGGMYTINGVDYAFDEEGYIHPNEWTYWTDGTCSYSLSDGRIAKNQWIDGIYYVDENGEMDCRLLDNDIPQYGSSNSTRDAYSDLEGESWDDGYGILEASQGGGCLGYIENGDWAAYHEVNFGSGAYKFIVNASALREGGYIDLHLDSLNGEDYLGIVPVHRSEYEFIDQLPEEFGYIDDCMYGMITVQYCGDDLVFGTVDEAKQFIDEVTA